MTVVTLQKKEKKDAEVSYQNWVSGSFTSSPQKLPKNVILTLGSTDGGVRVHGSAEKASAQKCGFEIGIKSIMLSFCGQGGRSSEEGGGGGGHAFPRQRQHVSFCDTATVLCLKLDAARA